MTAGGECGEGVQVCVCHMTFAAGCGGGGSHTSVILKWFHSVAVKTTISLVALEQYFS